MDKLEKVQQQHPFADRNTLKQFCAEYKVGDYVQISGKTYEVAEVQTRFYDQTQLKVRLWYGPASRLAHVLPEFIERHIPSEDMEDYG